MTATYHLLPATAYCLPPLTAYRLPPTAYRLPPTAQVQRALLPQGPKLPEDPSSHLRPRRRAVAPLGQRWTLEGP